MGMLTTSSLRDAKQNSIKLTDSAELIPTQSEQEIDFFNKTPQWQALHRFPRHVHCLTSLFELRRLPSQRHEQRQTSKDRLAESCDTSAKHGYLSITPAWWLSHLTGRWKMMQRIFSLQSRLTWRWHIVKWVTPMTWPPHEERYLRFNLIESSDVRGNLKLHDKQKLIKLS